MPPRPAVRAEPIDPSLLEVPTISSYETLQQAQDERHFLLSLRVIPGRRARRGGLQGGALSFNR